MQRATLVHRAVVACPICRLDDFVVHRRLPGAARGHVEKRCLCQRCGAAFAYTEDRLGRPIKK